jgi:very-short-patch-repair endonuclease
MECKYCQKDFKQLSTLRKHTAMVHKIKSEDFYVDYVLNGVRPMCKCGCGSITGFLSFEKGFVDYIQGHSSRVHNNWGHNTEANKKAHATQKEMRSNGMLSVWNKGLTVDDPRVRDNIDKVMANPDRGKHISEKLTGVKKTKAHIKSLSESAINTWKDPQKRIGQSERKIKWMSENNFVKSKTEDLFENLISNLGMKRNLDYACQYYVKDIKGFYDFYLFNKKILIEVDGDFWHCKPDSKYSDPKYAAQRINLITDAKKNKWAADNNIKLIRFWESDIKKNPDLVTATLKEML